MKLLKLILLIIQIILIGPVFWSAAEAGPKPCVDLVSPLHNRVNQIKDRGGMWDRFERNRELQNHSAIAMRIDSKFINLMFILDYLCATQDGIPYNDVAEYVVRKIKENGEKGFVEKHVALGHSLKEVKEWVEFAKFSKSNRERKLDFNQIKKTVEQAERQVAHYELLFKTVKLPKEVVADTKALIQDIDKLRITDPYLKQADYENSQIPHSSALSNTGDEM